MRALLPVGVASLLVATGLPGGPAEAADWRRYDNGPLIAWSDAGRRRTRALLEELEYFRAAVLQVTNVKPPADAPAVRVLVMADKRHFERLTSSRNVAGFMLSLPAYPVIVMPVRQGSRTWREIVIRHEYAHVLLSYASFEYPRWYNEGMAEMLSTLEIVDGQNAFIIGALTPRLIGHFRWKGNGQAKLEFSYDWDQLIGEGFVPHATRTDGSSAYAQAWLLAHYTSFGDDFANAYRLQDYFNRLGAGEASLAAFEAAFGALPSALYEDALLPYSRAMPTYTLPFDTDRLRLEFRESDTDRDALDRLLNFLEARAALGAESAGGGLADLAGTWTALDPERDCASVALLRIDEAGRLHTGTGLGAAPEILELDTTTDGRIIARHPPAAGEDDEAGQPVELELRPHAPGLACANPPGGGAGDCEVALWRCP